MKKNIFFLLFIFLSSIFIYSQTTVGFESSFTGNNTSTVTSTEVPGLTITIAANNVVIGNANGDGGSSGNVVSANGVSGVTFSFSTAVDIVDVLHYEISGLTESLTFTPTGGNNSAVISSNPGNGTTANLNWVGVTAFTVTGSTFSIYQFDNLRLSLSIPCTTPPEPTAPATSAIFGSKTSTSLNLASFTAPLGRVDGYAIYINDTNSFTAPSNGDEPAADLTWNGSGQQPIYFGTSATPNITVTDLEPGTTYYFQVYAYNNCSGTETYETTGLNANDTSVTSRVTLNKSDLIVLQYNSDGSLDEFALLALVDLAAGDVFFVSDGGWRNSSSNFVSLSEKAIRVTVGNTGINAGTIIRFDNPTGSQLVLENPLLGSLEYFELSGVVETGSSRELNLSTAGDQLLVFQTNDGVVTSTPTFIYGFNANDNNPNTNGWATGSIASSTQSNLPNGLVALNGMQTNKTAASAFGLAGLLGEFDNYQYSGVTTPASRNDWLTRVHTLSNWNTDTSIPFTNDNIASGGNVMVIGNCTAPTAPATSAMFGSKTSTSLNLASFTAPTGGTDGYAIYINDTNSFTAPSNGDEPVADLTWNGSGQQPVYFGTSATPNITVTDLDPGTTYYFQVYAYNNCSGTETYETTGLNANDTSALGVLTVSGLTGDNKVYDGTTAATASGTPTLAGVIGGDIVSIAGSAVFTFASANVGTGITINTTGYTLTGADAGKYTLTQPTLSADITAAELTVVGLTGDNKVYDGTTAATASGTETLAGVIGADDVSLGGSAVFTFASANVGTGITMNTTGYTISGTDSGNYTLTQPTLSADITAAELTVVGLTGDNKVYDGTTAATASGTETLAGVIGADDVSIAGSAVFTFASANVGTGIAMNTNGYTISGIASGNYTLTQPTLSADITAAELTVVGLTGDNKVYDGTTAATASGTETLAGVIGADDVSIAGSAVFTFASANVGTGITMNTTGYTISGIASGNYTLTQPTLSADITAAELTVVGLTGDNKPFDGTTAATATGTATLAGVIGADDVSIGGSPVFTFASASAGTGITMNTTGYTISGTDSGNYTLTQPTLSGDIIATELTIVGLTGDNKVYDGTTAATATGTPTLAGVIGGDDVSLGGSAVFTFASANVGTGITINTTGYTLTGADAGKYTLTQPTLSADITVAELTVVGLTGDNKVYDGTTAATASGTETLAGVIGADDVSIAGSAVFTFASANVGTGITMNTTGYTISGIASGNYTLTQPTLSADITAAELTVVGLTGDNKVYDGTTAATASGTETLAGVIGADDVSIAGSAVFTFASANVGTGIAMNTTGYTISGIASGNYTLTQPTLSADITAAELTVVGLTGDNKVYDGTTAATASGTATLAGVIGADAVNIGGSPLFTFASANVGTDITMNTSGYTISGINSGNYLLTQPILSADITAAELTVVGLTGDNKVYDGTTVATASGTATLAGVIGADAVNIGGSAVFTFASANAGTGITMNTSGYTISGTDSGNYTLTQPTLSADITAAELTVVGLTGDNKVYDGTTAATASARRVALVGVIGSDLVDLGGSAVFTFTSANAGTGITINTSGLTISGIDSGNYLLTQPILSADITAAELTIVGLTGDNKVYDGTTAATASARKATLAGVIGADDVNIGGSAVFTFASANVGTGITINTSGLTISGIDSGNYTLTQPTLSADITAAELTVVGLTGDNKPFDGTTAATASGTATLAGVIGADDVNIGGSAVFTFASANAGTGITINTSGLTISGIDSGNYLLTQPILSADITKADQVITFSSIPTKSLENDTDFQLEATSSSGLPVSYTFTFDSPAAAEVSSSGFVRLLSSGVIEITAKQEGNSNYSAAANVLQVLNITSSNSDITQISIGGDVITNPTELIYYLIDCNDTRTVIPLSIEAEANAQISLGANVDISTPLPGVYERNLSITSQDGTATTNYSIVLEKQFQFSDLVEQKYNNTLVVNNNPNTNGGYNFTTFKWYKNGVLVSENQSYSAGDSVSDVLDITADYQAVMITDEGKEVRTCNSNIVLVSNTGLTILNNPITRSNILQTRLDFSVEELQGGLFYIYDSVGKLVMSTKSKGEVIDNIVLPAGMSKGVYNLVFITSKGKLETKRFLKY